ncbi:MAG: hypothetical protein Q9227_006591 [Pyrenula ochraceoflavens]
MATASPSYEWLCIIPDTPSSLAKRLEVRNQHLKNITPHVDAKIVTLGGAMLAEQPKEGEQAKMEGSVMLVRANTREEVVERLKTDVYTTSGVWDMEKTQIIPFRTALRST